MVISTSILLVEDNLADAYLLIDMLVEQTNQQQWQITQVKNLRLALKSIHNANFAVVLLDLSLPDSKGLNTFTQLYTAAQDLPIIVLTGTDNQELALQAVTEGAQDYLVKGKIAPEALVQAIHHAIERGRILKQLQEEVLERQRSEQTLRLIVEGTAAVTGKDFFRSLVHSLAEALNVRYAFISECVDSPPTRVRAFAFWSGNHFGENFEYSLNTTPCELVLNRDGYLYCSQQVQSFFPEDLDLVQLQAQSYAGIALLNSSNKLLGHLAILNDQPMENESRYRAVLEIFAARAAAEMERLQMEEALRLSEEKFSKAFRSSPNAITISTLKDGRYIEVNENCLQMLGYNREEMIGRSAIELEVYPTEDRKRMMTLLEEQETISNLELELRKKSGAMLQGLLSAEIIYLENEPFLLAVTTDITALKQAEKALERLAEVGELASMIVHEVRNPLTTVLMGLNSFKKLSLPQRFKEYLALALDEAERLQRLLNQILLYAKPQTLQRTELELNNFIVEMLISLQNMPAALKKQLEFCPNPTSINILADKDKLKQILINLVTNAFEAIADEEIVTLKIQEEGVNQVCLQVHNGGEPIPPEVLSQLTKPFYTTKSTGNGLGLAIVKRIVEAHHGKLNLESSVNTGTRVTVRLPIN